MYEVSSLGRVRSLDKIVNTKGGKKRMCIGKILTPQLQKDGYYSVTLKDGNRKQTKRIHKLVAISFLNHEPCGMRMVVDHINFNRTDNRLCNLRVVTNRENTNQKHLKSASKYVGVSFHKKEQKWYSHIHYNKKQRFLGYFESEYKAHLAYQSKLKELRENGIID